MSLGRTQEALAQRGLYLSLYLHGTRWLWELYHARGKLKGVSISVGSESYDTREAAAQAALEQA